MSAVVSPFVGAVSSLAHSVARRSGNESHRFGHSITTPWTLQVRECAIDRGMMRNSPDGRRSNFSNKFVRTYVLGSVGYGFARTEYYRRHLFITPFSDTNIDVFAPYKMHVQSLVLSPFILPFALHTDFHEALRYFAKDTAPRDVVPYFFTFDPFRSKRN